MMSRGKGAYIAVCGLGRGLMRVQHWPEKTPPQRNSFTTCSFMQALGQAAVRLSLCAPLIGEAQDSNSITSGDLPRDLQILLAPSSIRHFFPQNITCASREMQTEVSDLARLSGCVYMPSYFPHTTHVSVHFLTVVVLIWIQRLRYSHD